MSIKNTFFLGSAILASAVLSTHAGDISEIQRAGVENKESPVVHWGPDEDKYVSWSSHTNRLIPVYAFGTRGAGEGIDLKSYTGENSAYRSADRLRKIYGYVPTHSVWPMAQQMDQTDVYRIQKAALDAGKSHIILVVFDGMDWHSTRAAAIYNAGKVGYERGRGNSLFFQKYTADGTTQFGFMTTSPHNRGTNVNVNKQTVLNPGGELRGGYNIARGGATPWAYGSDPLYWISKSKDANFRHAYTDSSASATSMNSGIKTYNGSVNIDATGIPVPTIAHQAQSAGYAIGVVTSVPISHATPAATYAHNVSRDDYQDITRDLLGLPSIIHSKKPLPGVDVMIGAGWGVERDKDSGQGKNYVPGNRYLAKEDLKAINIENGGEYVVAIREEGVKGAERLAKRAKQAADKGHRFFGFYGAAGGHLPYQAAAGDYEPGPGHRSGEIEYSDADISENPTLAEMTSAALTVLENDPEGFWLMVESGDVDWANHDNNIDAAIGAALSGDAAIKKIADWVEDNGGWNDTVMVVTADHGHYLVIEDPSRLIGDDEDDQ